MGDKLKPALIGGAIVGILSVIPVLGIGCCLWAIAGGAVAAYLYIKGSARPVEVGEGAMVGLLAGVVGAVIVMAVNLVMVAASEAAMMAMEAQFRERGIQMPFSGMGLIVIFTLILGICLAGLAAVGGLIGVSIFEKRKGGGGVGGPGDAGGPGGYGGPGGNVPPPPPNFGGGGAPGGGYGGGGSYGGGQGGAGGGYGGNV